ncbi:YkoP family protein [Hydrogenispora ethanolica]|nr:hypothetical protein [Hydrogenispora ethanolica]
MMMGVSILRRIGQAIDRSYLNKVGAAPIPGSDLGLLLVCYHSYEGKQTIELSDHTVIRPGQTVGELHFSNIRITEIAAQSERSLEWQLMEMLKQEMGTLAKACAAGLIPETVEAFYGTNVLAAGARRLGFTLIPIPKGWNRWWIGFWESVLRLVYYSFKTSKKTSLKRTMDPYEVWMSRAQLLQRLAKRRPEA